MQRRLADRGLTFAQVLLETRRGLATRYLEDDRLRLVEVAYLLGYSEQAAFQRAFKKWTGTTPAAYRQGHASSSA